MSQSERNPTLWTLCRVSTRIGLSMPRRLVDRHFSPPVDFLFKVTLLYPIRRNVSARISLRGLRRLIWVDTLRRVHNVGFSRGTAHILNSSCHFGHIENTIYPYIEIFGEYSTHTTLSLQFLMHVLLFLTNCTHWRTCIYLETHLPIILCNKTFQNLTISLIQTSL